jgi:hypothetical protein
VKSGHSEIGNFRLFISGAGGLYWDMLITELDPKGHYAKYINLHKDARFPFVEFKYPPIVVKEGSKETPEQEIYRNEHRYYEARKEMSQPLWRLHESKVEQVLSKCQELSDG